MHHMKRHQLHVCASLPAATLTLVPLLLVVTTLGALLTALQLSTTVMTSWGGIVDYQSAYSAYYEARQKLHPYSAPDWDQRQDGSILSPAELRRETVELRKSHLELAHVALFGGRTIHEMLNALPFKGFIVAGCTCMMLSVIVSISGSLLTNLPGTCRHQASIVVPAHTTSAAADPAPLGM